jgi:hypothetical protein
VDSQESEAPALAEGMRASRTQGGGGATSGFGRGRDTSTFTGTGGGASRFGLEEIPPHLLEPSDTMDDDSRFTSYCCRGFWAKNC